MSGQQLSPHMESQTQLGGSVLCAGATAMGGTDTAVIRYTSAMVTDAQGCFTLVEAAATGSIFTCVRPGFYAIDMFAGLAGAGVLSIGISLNAVAAGALTGSPLDFVAADAGAGSEGIIACSAVNSAAGEDTVRLTLSRTFRIAQGNVLRFMATAGVTLDADNSRVFMQLLQPG